MKVHYYDFLHIKSNAVLFSSFSQASANTCSEVQSKSALLGVQKGGARLTAYWFIIQCSQVLTP